MKRTGLVFLVTVFIFPLVFSGGTAKADGVIGFEAGRLTDEEWAIVQKHYLAKEPYFIERTMEDFNIGKTEALKVIRLERFYTGYFDLNEDGIEELFLVPQFRSLTCGSAGCDVDIFERGREGWQRLSSTKVGVFAGETPVLIIRDKERHHFYRRSDPDYKKLKSKYGKNKIQ